MTSSMSAAKQKFPEELDSVLKYKPSITVTVDTLEESPNVNHQCHPNGSPALSGSPRSAYVQDQANASEAVESPKMRSISISMPTTPLGLNTKRTGKVHNSRPISSETSNFIQPQETCFCSQPATAGPAFSIGKFEKQTELNHSPRIDTLKDKRFDSFKTWSGKLERQISHLRGRQEPEVDENVLHDVEVEALPVDRYFDALKGPELDTLRTSEELVLPKDKTWPFLLRYPISSFSICLGISSQAILWKIISTSESMSFLHVSPDINFILWCFSLAITCIVSFIYALKLIFYFEAVCREFFHPVRVNFFFAPWVTYMFLALSVPPKLAQTLHVASWYILIVPLLCLELKIYGQWMSGGQRRLSKVANPSNHLAIVGNFVASLLGASMGLKEGPIFFFAVGLAHYLVLFVTLYQRLPTNETLPKELHPVFFLFVAAPSVASMAWATIEGTFGFGSKIIFFIAMFLYCSLAVRINFFRGFRFSLAWWAYTFPMTAAAIATMKYTNEVRNPLTQTVTVVLSAMSTFTVTSLFVFTLYHGFVLQDLFPNDIAIAIARRNPRKSKKRFHQKFSSSESKGGEASLTSASSTAKDVESSALNNDSIV